MQTGRRTQSYKESIWRHLAEYKITVLGIDANGIWKNNNREYAHILPIAHRELNILEPYRREFWEWLRGQKIKLHSDFHHLSSSQAMCFNLFFPFLAEDRKYRQLLREVFAVDGEIRNAEFEVILDSREETNFDFCISANSRTLFEVKLTEADFGGATPCDSLLAKFERVYSPTLAGKFKPESWSCEVFLRNYQIMRNVWNLSSTTADTLVFLLPKANRSLAKGLAFLDSCVSEEYRSRVATVFLEDAVSAIETRIPETATRMREHFELFRQKYVPSLNGSRPHEPKP